MASSGVSSNVTTIALSCASSEPHTAGSHATDVSIIVIVPAVVSAENHADAGRGSGYGIPGRRARSGNCRLA